MNVILKSDFQDLLTMPGHVDIKVFYTGQKLFNAVIYHTQSEEKQQLMGVLIEDEKTPFTETDVDRFILKLHDLIQTNENVRIHELNVGKGVLSGVLH